LVGDSFKFGQGAAFKNKWIKKSPKGFARAVESIVDKTKEDLLEIKEKGAHSNEKIVADMKKRNLVEKQ
jgi:phenylalanyl-tRNA synthetase alpha chain